MIVLGIDYGKKKVGLSVGYTDNGFAEPLMVIRYDSEEKLLDRLFQVVQLEKAGLVVMGMPEGKLVSEIEEFNIKLKKRLSTLGIRVELQDETLSTKESQLLALQAGVKRKRRKEMEDAFAATLLLQRYLEKVVG